MADTTQNFTVEGRSNCERVQYMISLLPRGFGISLRWSIIIIAAVHFVPALPPFYVTNIVLPDGEQSTGISMMWGVIAFTASPCFVVWGIAHWTAYYDEIQSWEVAYITWGVGCSIGCGVYAVLVYLSKDRAKAELAKLLLFPFGVRASEAESAPFWAIPTVSFFTALMTGFVAHSQFEPKFEFRCDETYELISDLCYDGICCIAESADSDWIPYLGSLASTILAGWGIVKTVGYIISQFDDSVVINVEEDVINYLRQIFRLVDLETDDGRRMMDICIRRARSSGSDAPGLQRAVSRQSSVASVDRVDDLEQGRHDSLSGNSSEGKAKVTATMD